MRHWLLAALVLGGGGCIGNRGGGPPQPDATSTRWRDLVGCYQIGDGQFALDSVRDVKLNADRPEVRLARFAPAPAIVGGYWFVTERGMLWVYRLDGIWGRSYEFAVRGDSLVGRRFVRTDVLHARDEPTPTLALRTPSCRVGGPPAESLPSPPPPAPAESTAPRSGGGDPPGGRERRNRIRIGVRDDANAERVRRRIRELGIPPEAVPVEREEPARIRD